MFHKSIVLGHLEATVIFLGQRKRQEVHTISAATSLTLNMNFICHSRQKSSMSGTTHLTIFTTDLVAEFAYSC